jgi:hypothetical protein
LKKHASNETEVVNMPRSLAFLLALATLSATAALAQDANTAQSNFLPDSETPGTTFTQQQAAPIERSTPQQAVRVTSSQPIEGVWLRTAPGSSVHTVSADGNGTQIRVEHGIANVDVHHPAANTELLVDVPGGQVSLLKDGLYTFNAETNTVRVLRGEAHAFPSGDDKDAIKVKEDHQFAFGTGHSVDLNRGEARADLLGGERVEGRTERGYGGYYGPYGDGFYSGYGYPYGGGYPYYAWGSPWSYGPWGYPGFGVGFGYYGGFRGGYGGFGGFRGRR